MKNITMILLVILIGVGILAAGQVEYLAYMPLIQDDSPDPTATKTPRPPTPTPTATPTYVWAEGGNTCAYVFSARDWHTGSGMKVSAQVPSVCSVLEIERREGDGTLLVVKAHRIKTDTYGCRQSDFGPYMTWPPVDSVCPPPELPPPTDEWGRPLWGDYESFDVPFNSKIVCGYCAECGAPFTLNCVESE
jgi:hypothetical protein